MRKVFGIGEALMDIIFKEEQPAAAKAGGSVLNAFVSLGRLGIDVNFISEYGSDQVGDLIDKFLKENKVSTSYINRYTDGKTTLALAFLDEESNASYTFYKDYPEIRLSNLPQDYQENDIVLFGSIYAITRPVRKKLVSVLEKAREGGAIIYYDPNFRSAHLNELDELKPVILENMAYSDIIRGSDEDFKNIFDAGNSEEAYEAVHKYCSILIYTANKDGVFIHSEKDEFYFPVKALEPVSTIGAGDNFNAGVIYSLVKQDIERNTLPALDFGQWNCITGSGVSLASQVCMDYENYISWEFARDFAS